ncbi:MAG: EF-hand domain-containing protein [Verrucomicrobiaceae bacterium]|nr:EF-hand domain-containing protein [Verrucomicrobiaceae bacterium]
MKRFLVVTSALVAGLTVGLAQAEEGKGKGKKGRGGDPVKRAEAMLKNLDKDGNGTLSKEEYAAGPFVAKMKERRGEGAVDKVFAVRDTNKDGQLDKAELSAPPKGRGDRGKGKKGKGPRDGEGKKGKGPRDGEGDKGAGPRDGEGEKGKPEDKAKDEPRTE